MEATDEQWLPVLETPAYLVSSHGRVLSWPRAVVRRGVEQVVPSCMLKPFPAGRGGYLHVSLRVDGKTLTRRVHRLVLEAFVGPPPDGDSQGRHLDGNTANNRLDNLAWGDAKANAADKRRHGTIARGKTVGSAKLSPLAVQLIRHAAAQGVRQADLAAFFGVSPSNIRAVVKRQTWQHVP